MSGAHAGRFVLLSVSLALLAGIVGCHGGGDGGAAPAAIGVSSVAPCQGSLRGDLNGSGTPDITDAVGILRIIVGLDPANALADCDCDSATGITDAILVLRCIVGLGTWPILCGGPMLGDEMTGPDGQMLVGVPAGSFTMGSGVGWPDERPAHQVTLDGFWIGKYEVTNDAYATFLNDTQPADVSAWLDIASDYCGIEYVGDVYRAIAQMGNHPVLTVTWHGAVAYCSHYGYTLPTEAQWEYAAAGPDSDRYPWGHFFDTTKCCNWENRGPSGTSFPVGSFVTVTSWCGALDTAGNALEWCADWYASDYYQTSPALNPPGPADGTDKVARGGAWYGYETDCTASCRAHWDPALADDGSGFRVARRDE